MPSKPKKDAERKDPLYKSFSYALEGIFSCIKKERNIKIHLIFAVLVILAGIILGISITEWCICFTLFGLILSLELVNTAVEAVVDLVTEERKPLAKLAKDTAAGAVLIAAIMAAIVGCIIFMPKLVQLVKILTDVL
ncbi:MAG: diacylglycerol kinase family protein [Clostridiales bacterium]|nr:diacylglycerol kinase family protein [Clostridiales bacterium]